MKKLLIVLNVFALFFVGCQNENDSTITGPVTPTQSKISLVSDLMTHSSSVTKTIDGSRGGTIYLTGSTLYKGKLQSVSASVNFAPGAFNGRKAITVTANFDSISLSFYPHMVFNGSDLVKLNATFTGVNLNLLTIISGYNSSSEYCFCYFGDDNSYEIIKNDGIDASNAQSQIAVKNARLKHFSRYCWATRR